jgi:hypothetical protein
VTAWPATQLSSGRWAARIDVQPKHMLSWMRDGTHKISAIRLCDFFSVGNCCRDAWPGCLWFCINDNATGYRDNGTGCWDNAAGYCDDIAGHCDATPGYA